MVKASDLKVGDVIKCMSAIGDTRYEVGKTYEVTEADSDAVWVKNDPLVCHAKYGQSSLAGYELKSFEKVVTSLDIKTLKVGDKVRCISAFYDDRFSVGETYSVLEVNGGSYPNIHLKHPEGKNGRTGGAVVYASDLKHFEKVESMLGDVIVHNGQQYRKTFRKAKVGDLVVVLSNESGADTKVGSVHTVKGTTSYDITLDTPRAPYLADGEYAVLVPVDSEVYVYNGIKYRKVSRAAKVGELALVLRHRGCPKTAGSVVTVIDVRSDGHILYKRPHSDAGTGSMLENYVVLEPTGLELIVSVSTSEPLEKRVATLEAEVAELKKRPYSVNVTNVAKTVEQVASDYVKREFVIDGKAYREIEVEFPRKGQLVVIIGNSAGNKAGPNHHIVGKLARFDRESYHDSHYVIMQDRPDEHRQTLLRKDVVFVEEVKVVPPTPSRRKTRAEVVSAAKADVESLVKTVYGNGWSTSGIPKHSECGPLKVEFDVDRIKRKVNVTLYWKNVYGRCGHAVSRASDGDVFNAHIGKAIALRRALKLPIPDDYLNAPQPQGFAVGDVVSGSRKYGYYTPEKRFTITSIEGGSYRYAEKRSDWMYKADIGAVIDDTDRVYDAVPEPTPTKSSDSYAPKVGDTVRKLQGIHSGVVGVVTAIRPAGFVSAEKGLTFKTSDGKECWAFIEWVEVVKRADEKPKTRFGLSVGDRIKITSRESNWYGMTGTVTNDNTWDGIMFKSDKNGQELWAEPKWVTRINDMPFDYDGRDLKVGDVVELRSGRKVTIYAWKSTHREKTGFKFSGPNEGFTYIDEDNYEFWMPIKQIKRVIKLV